MHTFLGISLEGWLTILAIIVGPLLAFEVQRRRDNRRERRNNKLFIYRKLVMTLKAQINVNHVDAINSIQTEFHSDDSNDKKVLAAWRLYISHLNSSTGQSEDDRRRWSEKKFDLLIDLVYQIGQGLGYTNIDKATLRDSHYLPQGMVDADTQMTAIRHGWSGILDGTRPVAVTVVAPVQVEDATRLQTPVPRVPADAVPKAQRVNKEEV